MISASQLRDIRDKAARVIEDAFAVEIEIDGQAIPAARHRRTSSGSHALDGVLPEADVTWRVRRAAIPSGIVIMAEKTLVREGGQPYRVEVVTDPVGDPCIVIQARAL